MSRTTSLLISCFYMFFTFNYKFDWIDWNQNPTIHTIDNVNSLNEFFVNKNTYIITHTCFLVFSVKHGVCLA
jgi:hypothetical protein